MIETRHLQEWEASHVDRQIIELNVRSLFADDIYYICHAVEDRINTGRLAAKWVNRYHHCCAGGWWCDGVDVLTGASQAFEEDGPYLWGQFKPDNPRTYEKKNGFGERKPKTIKYESPPKVDTGIYALRVPLHIWQRVAEVNNVSMPENIVIEERTGQALGFWSWVLNNPSISLIITEGAKKAGCLLTLGYAAIALPGIYNGYRQPKDGLGNRIGLPRLIPQLEIFAVEGRSISFCFDNDSKPSTRKNVRKTIIKTGKLLQRRGCEIKVISWTHPAKGVDDLIAATDPEYFHDIYDARKPLHIIEHGEILDLSKYVNLTVNEQYLPEDLPLPEDAQLIGIGSAKGTNKTGLLAAKVAENRRLGIKTIVITHRIQLAKALAERFGIDHIEEIRRSETGGVFGYCLCIDSVHPRSLARFDPEYWAEAHLILDEADQVIWHLLNSDTCKKNRVSILDSFTQLIKTIVATSGKIYLSSADLSGIEVNYIEQLIGYPIKRYVVNNVFNTNRHRNRRLIAYRGNEPTELIAEAEKAISVGKKLLIHTSGQKEGSVWGTINLERDFRKKFPALKILRIDAVSVAEPGHPACGCMENLNAVLVNYDLVICSPTVETGVSIDVKGYFDSVWCIGWGNQTTDAVCQSIERLRDDVPRHIWVKKTGLVFVGNKSTSVKELLRATHKKHKANIQLLEQADRNNYDELSENGWQKTHLTTWAKRASIVNAGMWKYRQTILSKLEDEGYRIEDYKSDNSELGIAEKEAVKDRIVATRNSGYKEHCSDVSKAEDTNDRQLDRLRDKRAKTKAERLAERKGNLRQRYGVEVTDVLVEKDDKGWYSQLALHYYLTIGNHFVTARDKKRLSNLTEGTGRAFKPDVNKSLIGVAIKCLELLSIKQFFGVNLRFTKDSLKDWFSQIGERTRWEIRTILGVNICASDSPISAANKLLKLLGLKLEHKGKWCGGRKNKQRIYHGCNVNPDERDLVFEQWLKRDTAIEQEVNY